jgi:hypothetical protein
MVPVPLGKLASTPHQTVVALDPFSTPAVVKDGSSRGCALSFLHDLLIDEMLPIGADEAPA